LMFVSYKGQVHPVDVSEDEPEFAEPWSILGDDDEGWLPGGWQPIAYSSESKRLYVLMHEGGPSTHKWPGTEVWVYDTKKQERIERIELGEETQAISISPDDEQLYALGENAE